MNANGSGHCRRASLQNRNLITRVRGITFGLQTTALNGNCRLPEASNRDWAIVSIAYRHFGVTAPTHEQRGEEWAHKRGGEGGQRCIMNRRYGRRCPDAMANIVFARLSIKLF